MVVKICPFCGGKIPKEKIEEFDSKFRAKESEIKKGLEKNFKEKLKEERDKTVESIKQQKEIFDEFKKTLKEDYEKDRERLKGDFNILLKEKTKTKDDEIISIKKKLEEAESERGKIKEKIEKDYEERVKELIGNKDKEIANLRQKYAEENDKLKSDFEEKIRELAHKTPSELGAEGQAEVVDILTRTFPHDDIKETKHGKPGSDIFHKIFHQGEEVGFIVYEVKNVNNWNNNFIDQVKEQKTKHSANYAILVTNILPGKEKIISERDGILIVHPTKVDIIARQIRTFLLEAHKAKLSAEEVEEKIKAVQEYLTSPDYKNMLSELFYAIKDWHELRFKEKNQHERHWADEEKINKKIQEKTGKIHAKIASIIESRIEKIQIDIKRKKRR